MTERVEYTKRTAILGKTHVQQSFLHKRELTELSLQRTTLRPAYAIPIQQAEPELRRIE